MRSAHLWWVQILATVLLPFALTIGSYQLALLMPGTVKVSLWEMAASVFFVAASIPVGMLLYRSPLHWFIRALVTIFTFALLVVAALTLHVHSTCEKRPPYIGEKPQSEQVASCN
jgi:hypothetical protein